MNESKNLQLVKQWYDAIARGDLQAIVNGLAEDIISIVPTSKDIIPWSGTWQGRDQLFEVFRLRSEAIEVETYETRDFVVQDNKVVAFLHERAICNRTGIPFEIDFIHYIHLRDDKIAKMELFFDPTSLYAAFLGQKTMVLQNV